MSGAPILRTYLQHIDGPAGQAFDLLCPVREAEWLDGWAEHCQVVHTASGIAERGCVFRTPADDAGDMVWVITAHDRDAGRVEFCRVVADREASTLRLAVLPDGPSACFVHVEYVILALSQDAVGWVEERWAEDEFVEHQRFWEASMNHFLATGQLLRQ